MPTDGHLDAYRSALSAHGPGFEATLWGSPETQTLRFEVICDLVGDPARSTVIDIGCGDGALARHFASGASCPAAYVGLDALEPQIHRARSTCPAWATFRVQDVTESWPDTGDWVVCSGTLNTMDEERARDVVDHAWRQCRRGVVFNFLSTRAHPKWLARDTGPARRFDPLDWAAWAMSMSPRVAMRHDYLEGHDATIAMYAQE